MTFSGCPIAKLASRPGPSCPVSVDAAAYPRANAFANAGCHTSPDHPPLPTPMNFPFQFSVGNHTSILIVESGTGRIVAATRQNAGRRSYDGNSPPPMIEPGVSRFTVSVSGGTNLPPSTGSDNVIVVSGRAKPLRLVHDAPSK